MIKIMTFTEAIKIGRCLVKFEWLYINSLTLEHRPESSMSRVEAYDQCKKLAFVLKIIDEQY